MAASCRGRKIPESTLDLTWANESNTSALPIAIPTRQPAMLKVLDRELNSTATSNIIQLKPRFIIYIPEFYWIIITVIIYLVQIGINNVGFIITYDG